MTQLFAICHDGTTNGDCEGDPLNTLPVDSTEVDFEQVLKLYGEGMESDCFDAEEITTALQELKGAWIVSKETVDLMEAVVDAVQPRSDSVVYATQRALKAITKHLAIKSLGEEAI